MDLFEDKNIKPMLISEMTEPFNDSDWIYELKLDGIRCIAYLDSIEQNTELRNKRNLSLLPKVPEKGIELFEVAKAQKLEGVIAKKKDSKYYLDKRTKEWIKFKFLADKDFVVCGYIVKAKGITSIVLGLYNGTELIYQGHVTMGVKHGDLQKLETISQPPFAITPPGNENAIWLKPELVCVVNYMPNEKEMLRQPVFKGFRDDMEAIDCQVLCEV